MRRTSPDDLDVPHIMWAPEICAEEHANYLKKISISQSASSSSSSWSCIEHARPV